MGGGRGKGSGTGSPVWFKCWRERQVGGRYLDHEVTLTGRTREFKPRRAPGSRSTRIAREYRCSCGHVGWSAHIDLARLATTQEGDRG